MWELFLLNKVYFPSLSADQLMNATYHGQAVDVEVGNGHRDSLPLVIHGCHLHHVTLLLGSLSKADLEVSETQ